MFKSVPRRRHAQLLRFLSLEGQTGAARCWYVTDKGRLMSECGG